MNGTPKRRGLFFPLLLVGLGVFLLLINLGILPGTTRDNLLMYWPAILILMGLDGFWKRSGLVWPIMLLGLGTLLLMGNLGYLSVSALPLLGKIWPILLVAIGIDIAFSRQRGGWYIAMRVVLGVIVVGLILWLALAFPVALNTRTVNFEQPMNGELASKIEFDLVGGRIMVSGGADADQLLDGTAVLPGSASLAPSYTQPVSGKSSLKIGVETGRSALVIDQSTYGYDFKVNSAVPVDFKVDMAVGDLRFDLANTLIQRLETEMAVGSQTLTIPCEEGLTVQVEQAVGSVTLNVPAGCDVTVRLDNAVVGTTIPSGWLRQDNFVTNPNASSTAGTVEVRIGVAVGSVSIHEIN